jgi:hypothetical protein
MIIEFVASHQDVETLVPMPKPAKMYIPDWYKDIRTNNDPHNHGSKNNLKRCVPYLDALTTGYIQETWTDIQIQRDMRGMPTFNIPIYPKVIDVRESVSVKIPDVYYPVEFVWKLHWYPKLPKGWSALITSPLNRLDLPFRSLTGVLDSDVFYHMLPDPVNGGGNYPFFLLNGFEGIIPVGTPMYQIIPFKRENWKAVAEKFDFNQSLKRGFEVRKFMTSGYKRAFWQKKTYE